jgi:hypothetical protein
MEETQDGISDEILKQAEEYIKELLKNKRLKTSERAQLEIQSYFLMFLATDHDKISKMYPFFKKQAERQKRWDDGWSRLQWVAIPIALTYAIGALVDMIKFLSELYQKIA